MEVKYPSVWKGPRQSGRTRSGIESYVATALDVCGFEVNYEILGPYFGKGFDRYYTPDFYVKEQGVLIEVGGDRDEPADKNGWDDHHVRQVAAFYANERTRQNVGCKDPRRYWVLAVNSNGIIQETLPSGQKVPWRQGDTGLHRCATCGRWYFEHTRFKAYGTDGVFCPHCESADRVKLPHGKTAVRNVKKIVEWWQDGCIG